jgi:VanZ family protein
MGTPQQPRAEQHDDADRDRQDDADGAVGVHPRISSSRRWLAAWGPVVLWLGVIAWLSGEGFSDEQTAAWLVGMPLFDALGIPPALIDTANLILRKTAHFVEYATLSMLTYRALGHGSVPRPRRVRLAGALILALVCATLDELHQATTLTRTGTPRDVVLDGLGAAAGALVGGLLLFRRSR